MNPIQACYILLHYYITWTGIVGSPLPQKNGNLRNFSTRSYILMIVYVY